LLAWSVVLAVYTQMVDGFLKPLDIIADFLLLLL
jgi:hypothetical protein